MRVTLRARLRQAMERLAGEHASTGRLALAVAVGTLIGASPFYGMHLWIGLAVGRLFRLNQVAIFLGEQVSLPFIAPFLAFASVQVGHAVRFGQWLDFEGHALTGETAAMFFADWLLGSLLVGLVLAALTGAGARALLRAVRGEGGRAWTGRSRGNALGYAIFFHTVRLLGRRGGYALLWVVLPYYMLFAGGARRASRGYLDRVLGPRGFWRRQLDTFRHLQAFGRSLIDNLLLLAGREASFEWRREGVEHLDAALAQGPGAILLSAHVGSRAMGGHKLRERKLNIVAYQNEAEGIRRFLERHAPEGRPAVIEVNDGPGASLAILRALRRGEPVAMLADRAIGGPTVTVTFLGAPLRLPRGPFLLAALSGAPVLITFGAKHHPRTHAFQMRPPISLAGVPRAGREAAIQGLAQTFSTELEAFVRAHPYQWFNFYDVWEAGGGAPERRPGSAHEAHLEGLG